MRFIDTKGKYIISSLYGDSDPDGPCFGGYQRPKDKTKPAFSVFDIETKKLIYIQCLHIDYKAFMRKVSSYQLNEAEARFTCELNELKGEGTQKDMKILPSTEDVEVLSAKARAYFERLT